MIFFVVVTNLFITLVNIYLAVKIMQLTRQLKRTTNTLIKCEKRIHSVLSLAPQFILPGQKNIDNLRQGYQLLQLQLQKIRQLLWLLSLIYRFGRRAF
ncbi:MAG: hypothetical protein QNJ41_05735 [Xenococcaceae cyanobacterium MO_188.B32]|nr:hypothetical protein [Xenococcaceae cyanobacterium MO_188.B32]